MQGVEILTFAQVVTEWSFNSTAFWTTIIGILLIAVIWGVITSVQECDWSFFIILTFGGLVLGSLLGMLAGDELFKIPTTYETQYKVTISDEVSMTEFYERYEVIEQDGKIFTVREN